MLNQSTHRSWACYRAIMPAAAGSIMLIASFLPWLTDPTGNFFCAWQLPVDVGWQLRSGIFNYGLLCLACACSTFFIAYLAWRTLQIERDAEITGGPLMAVYSLATYARIAAWLCLIPALLFVLQYLFIDMGSVAMLTRNELQLLLVKTHFNYSTTDQFMPIQSLAFQPLNFSARLALVLDHSNIGLFLPLASTLILLLTHTLHVPQYIYEANNTLSCEK